MGQMAVESVGSEACLERCRVVTSQTGRSESTRSGQAGKEWKETASGEATDVIVDIHKLGASWASCRESRTSCSWQTSD